MQTTVNCVDTPTTSRVFFYSSSWINNIMEMQSPRLISGRSRISLDDTQDSPGYTHGGGVGGCLKPNLNFGEFFKKKIGEIPCPLEGGGGEEERSLDLPMLRYCIFFNVKWKQTILVTCCKYHHSDPDRSCNRRGAWLTRSFLRVEMSFRAPSIRNAAEERRRPRAQSRPLGV